MKKILVTGANGFLGGNLVRMLKEENYDVRILVRKNADLHLIREFSSEICYGRIDDKNDVFNAVDGCQYVVHAASITEQHGITFEQYEQINVTATKYVVEACMAFKVQKLVYVSTANTFGPGSILSPGTEMNGFSYFKAGSGYINSKYLAQQLILELVQQKQLPAVIVNPTFMIGAFDSKPSSGQIILYAQNKRLLFYPPGGKNFVYTQDVCRGIIKAIADGKIGNCYLLAGENLSFHDFFKLIVQATGQKSLMLRIPPFVLKTGAVLSSLTRYLGHQAPRLSYANAYLLCQDNYYSGKKSEKELGIKYTPIKVAVKDACDWFNG